MDDLLRVEILHASSDLTRPCYYCVRQDLYVILVDIVVQVATRTILHDQTMDGMGGANPSVCVCVCVCVCVVWSVCAVCVEVWRVCVCVWRCGVCVWGEL